MLPAIDIPHPFLINLLKHHVVYSQQLFKHYNDTDEPNLLTEFSKGNNLLCDYYYGNLSPDVICAEAKLNLLNKGKFDINAYQSWIRGQSKNYVNMELSDGSTWTLLIGRERDRYIHLHPARYSKHTIRVRFLALKTAMLYKIFYPFNKQRIDHDAINVLRDKFLLAPPLKKGSDIRHLEKVLALFY